MTPNIEKFLNWVNNNDMHILLTPTITIDNQRVATIREDCYKGAFGYITKSIDNCSIFYDHKSFGFLIGDSGWASLCGYGRNNEEAILDLYLILFGQTERKKDLELECGSILEIGTDLPKLSGKRIKIPSVE